MRKERRFNMKRFYEEHETLQNSLYAILCILSGLINTVGHIHRTTRHQSRGSSDSVSNAVKMAAVATSAILIADKMPMSQAAPGGQIIFSQIGLTSTQVSFATIKKEIRVGAAIDFTEAIIKKLEANLKNLWDEDQANENNMISLMKDDLRRLRRIEKWISTTPTANRQKRGIWAVALPFFAKSLFTAGVMTLFHHLLSSRDIANLNKHAQTVNEIIGDFNDESRALLDNAKNQNFYLGKTTEIIALQHHAYIKNNMAVLMQTIVRRITEEHEDIFAAAMDNRAHPIVYKDMDLDRANAAIQEQAHGLGQTPVYHAFSDWLQYEAYFVARPERHSADYDILISIPVISRDSEMILYRHIPMPMKLNNGQHIFLIPGDNIRFISINEGAGVFRTLAEAEFQECTKKGKHYICPRGNVARSIPDMHNKPDEKSSRDASLCMIALFTENHNFAIHHCERRVVPQTEMATQISPTEFAMFTNSPHQARVQCTNDSISFRRKISIRDTQIITIPQGCKATTKTFLLHASDVIFDNNADDWRIQYDWPLNPHSLLNKAILPSTEQSREVSRRIQELQGQIHKQAQLLQGVKHIPTEEIKEALTNALDDKREIATWVALVGVPTLIICVIILVICYRKYPGFRARVQESASSVASTARTILAATPTTTAATTAAGDNNNNDSIIQQQVQLQVQQLLQQHLQPQTQLQQTPRYIGYQQNQPLAYTNAAPTIRDFFNTAALPLPMPVPQLRLQHHQ